MRITRSQLGRIIREEAMKLREGGPRIGYGADRPAPAAGPSSATGDQVIDKLKAAQRSLGEALSMLEEISDSDFAALSEVYEEISEFHTKMGRLTNKIIMVTEH